MSQRCSDKLYHVTSLHNVKMNTSRGCKGMFIVQSHQEFGFYLKSLCDWITKRAPLSKPIRFKTGYIGSMQHWIYWIYSNLARSRLNESCTHPCKMDK